MELQETEAPMGVTRRSEGLPGLLRIIASELASGCSRSAESLVWCTLGPAERERGQQQLLPMLLDKTGLLKRGGVALKGVQPKAKTLALAISYSCMSMFIPYTYIYKQNT